MAAIDAADSMTLQQIRCVTHFHFIDTQIFSTAPSFALVMRASYPVIDSRWDTEWIQLLLLAVALVSIAAFRFFMSKADTPVLGAAAQHNQAALPKTVGASHSAPKSDETTSSTHPVALGNSSTFLQLAVQLKTDNKLREAGQRLFHALRRPRVHYVDLQSINDFCRIAATKDCLPSTCCRKDQGYSNLTSLFHVLTSAVGAGRANFCHEASRETARVCERDGGPVATFVRMP
jgi:hypothetical protein